ncbi:sarcosine oxidase subunit alpha family protein [Bordetella flabilis]|uniref:Sarcosine oxidase subunit alpha n=1 Tax=Bordetella flabilis TaxID=463014 RepID=A0A193GK75_9BORD|nr:sarcosine oxidase subunit alpha family protein [Bordetella flabilis]ANN79988.1 sarcosine oxidase subunit alpha [Bordetella flabilis]
MKQQNRIQNGGNVDRARPISFTFNGKRYVGLQGDTLASALLANDVHFVARSFKYHRPRGIVSAGPEEPNAIVQLEDGPHTVPNAKATEIELYEGLTARSVNAFPSLEKDRMAFNQRIARFLPAGFYYKTFMWPRSFWPRYERHIRDAAGLGTSPAARDPSRYDKRFAHCDLLIVGGGVAGLSAALAAAGTGARIILVDDQAELGGFLLSSPRPIGEQSSAAWIARARRQLAASTSVTILNRSTAFGYHDHNLVTVTQRLHDHLPLDDRIGTRELLWKIRARRVILATGAHERPIVFGNNDLPGIMLASAVSSYIHRYGVLPGRNAVVFCNNDEGYRTAIALAGVGATVVIVDARKPGHGALIDAALRARIRVCHESVVVAAAGDRRVSTVKVRRHANGGDSEDIVLRCDLVAVSGGLNPTIHLFSQSGGKARWDDVRSCFVPGSSRQAEQSVGAAKGTFGLAAAMDEGVTAGRAAVTACGFEPPAQASRTGIDADQGMPILPLWQVTDDITASRGPKQFVDFQNDVTTADIMLAVREGFESVEHVKRYTALGFGTDQGKLGNINGMGILAGLLDKRIADVGTTTFRPNYTPVSFGAFSGRDLGLHHEPVRKTCLHDWHAEHGAVFEDVGAWKRPWYYPRNGEDMHAAVARECLAVRRSVALLDVSTLGKIDIQGSDAVKLLNWVYTNDWSKLAVGRARYGLMLNENGMIFDDGVTVRLGEEHFLMTTTTGNAATVMNWLELWLQTEWPDMRVRLTSVTDHWCTIAVPGPRSRDVLRKVCDDIDFGNAAFPFMSYREGTVAGVSARVMRISFSGELAYEVNVPADYGRVVWEALMAAGAEYGIVPYGTEALHVLRAEKGFIIVGQDTDGSMTPADMGMGGMVSKNKECLGKRSLSRSDTAGQGRRQYVGLLTEDAAFVLPEGSQILPAKGRDRCAGQAFKSAGHVTSSYFSPILHRSIALAMLRDGSNMKGQTVRVGLANGSSVAATVCDTVFFDKEGLRQNVE